MAGQLYICATPIGNLEDITIRVIETLKKADLIAAEDTRNSIRLLNHYEIKTPMTSYHEFNRIEKANYLIGVMKTGKNVALITDAGTPAISDPGEDLVIRCREEGVSVTSLPGASACITALTLSGLSTRRFCFEGFLPPDKKERREILEELKQESRTMIFYEAPHRLLKTLEEIYTALGERKITLCREITKKFETVLTFTLSESIEYYKVQESRGEFVLVVQGKSIRDKKVEERSRWSEISLRDHMQLYTDEGMEKKEAMKQVAKDRGIGKRDVYSQLL